MISLALFDWQFCKSLSVNCRTGILDSPTPSRYLEATKMQGVQ
ncbi:hypothetical protein Z949_4097 [Sulfitobacter guttiformis KCTC 32187]|nr:hypothetical protein Z949_4097 [Sulfitobacter guttiformis KCTC 32187]